jgi:predicted lipid-binding transport protein (Tim44 family)
MSMADGLAWERKDREARERTAQVSDAGILIEYLTGQDAPDNVREAFIRIVGPSVASHALRLLFIKDMS